MHVSVWGRTVAGMVQAQRAQAPLQSPWGAQYRLGETLYLGSEVMGFKSKLLSIRFWLMNKICVLEAKQSRVLWILLTTNRVAQCTCKGRNKM